MLVSTLVYTSNACNKKLHNFEIYTHHDYITRGNQWPRKDFTPLPAKQASLSASVDSVVANITLDLVTGFPGSYPYTLVIDPDTNKEELITVTSSGGGTNLNVTRGSDSTTAIAHSTGATVRHVVSGQDFNEFSAHIGSVASPTTSAVHGVAGDIVGTTDAQILSNKTLGSNLAAATYKITGLGTPTVSTDAATKAYVDTVAGSATAAAASATAAAASYDSFDDRYLGPYASAPTLDNDGNALLTGALYWNTVTNSMQVWSGSAWGSISSTADIYRYRFVAAGGETSVSGADANGQTLSYIAGKEQVYLNGVLLVRTTDYTAATGTSITGLTALAISDVLEIITFTAFSVTNAILATIVDAKGDLIVGTGADTVGRLPVGTNGYFLKADSTAGTGLVWSNDIESSIIMNIMGAYL